MFKKMMAALVLTFTLAAVAGTATTTTQQWPLPCPGCKPSGGGN